MYLLSAYIALPVMLQGWRMLRFNIARMLLTPLYSTSHLSYLAKAVAPAAIRTKRRRRVGVSSLDFIYILIRRENRHNRFQTPVMPSINNLAPHESLLEEFAVKESSKTVMDCQASPIEVEPSPTDYSSLDAALLFRIVVGLRMLLPESFTHLGNAL